MDVEKLPSGRYIVAVSGGVDSMVLLDVLSDEKNIELVIAHFNHGIRDDSGEDEALVRQRATELGYTFESTEAKLGKHANEEMARKARYEFLQKCRKKYNTKAIVTAHHQDDVLETIIINHLRGTGWRGLCSLRSTAKIHRPLLSVSRQEIEAYAADHRLIWRHDSTNDDLRIVRNRVRNIVVPQMTREQRRMLLDLSNKQCDLREEIEAEISKLQTQVLIKKGDSIIISRYWLIMSDPEVADEVLRSVAAEFGVSLLPSQRRALLLFSKVAKPGAQLKPGKGVQCSTNLRQLIVSQE